MECARERAWGRERKEDGLFWLQELTVTFFSFFVSLLFPSILTSQRGRRGCLVSAIRLRNLRGGVFWLTEVYHDVYIPVSCHVSRICHVGCWCQTRVTSHDESILDFFHWIFFLLRPCYNILLFLLSLMSSMFFYSNFFKFKYSQYFFLILEWDIFIILSLKNIFHKW